MAGCGRSTAVVPALDGSLSAEAAVPSDAAPGPDAGPPDATSSSSPADAAPTNDGPPCAAADAQPACNPAGGLQCQVNYDCPDGGHTTLRGVVYDPAGRTPLYNAAVYVPRHPAALAPIATGTSLCTSCEAPISDYVTIAATDASGSFTLLDVPSGGAIPLVVQVGKWRRMATVTTVQGCAETDVPAELTRLPRNQTEGDMPQMALLTGGCDNVACFLRSIGVDAAEFGAPHAGGRVDVYQGLGASGPAAPLSGATAGDCTTSACPLWSSEGSLAAYDAVLLGCECAENDQTKPAAAMQALHDWLGHGGLVFATHSQATWFKNGPADFQAVASWVDGPASGAAGPFAVDATTEKGMAFLQWLTDVGAAAGNGTVSLDPVDVSTSVTSVSGASFEWIDDTSTAPEDGSPLSGNVKAFSFETPLASAPTAICGRAYFTDVHPGGGQALTDPSADGGGPAAIPEACDGGPLTAEEMALEFLLFERGICVDDTEPPPLPPCPADGGSQP